MKAVRVEIGIMMDVYLGEQYESEEMAMHLAEQIAMSVITFKDEPGVDVTNFVATAVDCEEI